MSSTESNIVTSISGFGPEAYLLPGTSIEKTSEFSLPPIFALDISVPHFALRRRNAIVEAQYGVFVNY
ncbi:7832_t:CDS:2 [Acaulospora morrowiae]|uniref:7832_t:CDS:1 n=1 Tax=Acaulospora morrowiae TaxID=94023 RepID=A0A9N9AS38_9GLOM|nr:7832_t:CDS:2 [Acaulospora morrowiae]